MLNKNSINNILIIILLLTILILTNKLFIYKDENFYTYQNFINQEENSIDILVLGSSHSMNGIDSMELDQQLAIKNRNTKTFNMSVTGMRFETMPLRLKDALRRQKPKLLIIETFSAVPNSYSNTEITRRYAIDYLPLSYDKIQFINNYIEQDRASFFFPLIRYHSRWDELEKNDFFSLYPKWLRNYSSSYGLVSHAENTVCKLEDSFFMSDFSTLSDCVPLEKEVEDSLIQIITLAQENNIQILFLCLPYKIQMSYPSEDLIKNNNYIANEYCDQKDIFFLDLNKYYSELNWSYRYMQDEGHLNGFGREIVLPIIAQFIHDNYPEIGLER